MSERFKGVLWCPAVLADGMICGRDFHWFRIGYTAVVPTCSYHKAWRLRHGMRDTWVKRKG